MINDDKKNVKLKNKCLNLLENFDLDIDSDGNFKYYTEINFDVALDDEDTKLNNNAKQTELSEVSFY